MRRFARVESIDLPGVQKALDMLDKENKERISNILDKLRKNQEDIDRYVKMQRLKKRMKDIDPDIAKVVQKHFWDMPQSTKS